MTVLTRDPPIDQRDPSPADAPMARDATPLDHLEQQIIEALGPQNFTFLCEELRANGLREPSIVEVLRHAQTLVSTDDSRNRLSHAISTVKLASEFLHKQLLPTQLSNDGNLQSVVTNPHGESRFMIDLSLDRFKEDLYRFVETFPLISDELHRARISRAPGAVHTSQTVETAPSAPAAPAGTGSSNSSPRPEAGNVEPQAGRSHVLRAKISGLAAHSAAGLLKVGARTLRWAATALAILQSNLPEGGREVTGAAIDRLRGALGSLLELSVKGFHLHSLSERLGYLAPRLSPSRLTQTGFSSESHQLDSATRGALLRFELDLSEISKFFKRNPHLDMFFMNTFFQKEVFVVTDGHSRLERLDSFLRKTAEGRALLPRIYQLQMIPSKVDASPKVTVTIPIIPLIETSLPVLRMHYIVGIQFLDAKGSPIDQGGSHQIKACVFGGALVSAPATARMVRYSLNPQDTPDDLAPSPLTSEEFEGLRALLPTGSFELGAEGRLVYEAINQLQNPRDRIEAAITTEERREWSYSMAPGVRRVHNAAGDAFHEAVYHMRTGICDSMSATGAYVFGSAIGNLGLVLTGPTASGYRFDLQLGHSITRSVGPTFMRDIDLTHFCKGKINMGRAPRAWHRLLDEAIGTGHNLRAQVAEIYADLGDLIRGYAPTRFAAPQELLEPVRALNAPFKRITPRPAQRRTRECSFDRIKLALELDAVLARKAASNSAAELVWFLAMRLEGYTPRSADNAPLLTKMGQDLLSRDLARETTEQLVNAIHRQQLSIEDCKRIPDEFDYLRQRDVLLIVEALSSVPDYALTARRLVCANLLSLFISPPPLSEFKRWNVLMERVLHNLTTEEESLVTSALFRMGLRGNETSERLREIARSLSVVYRSIPKEARIRPIAKFLNNLMEQEFLRRLSRECPSEVRLMLAGNTPEAIHALEQDVATAFIELKGLPFNSTLGFELLKELVPELNLSRHQEPIQKAVRRFLKKSAPYRFNWPDDSNPASMFAIEQELQGNWPYQTSTKAVGLLKSLILCGGLDEQSARALLGHHDERERAQLVLTKALCNDIHTGRLHFNRPEFDSPKEPLPLHELPCFFRLLSNNENSINQEAKELAKNLFAWAQRQGVLKAREEDRHLIRMWQLVTEDGRAQAQRSSPEQGGALPGITPAGFQRVLLTLATQTLNPRELFEAIQNVAPLLIRPSDVSRLAEYNRRLSALARELRAATDDQERLAALKKFTPFTKRTVPLNVKSMVGIAEAVTVFEILTIAPSLPLNLDDGTIQSAEFARLALLREDDGSNPLNQISVGAFADISSAERQTAHLTCGRLTRIFSSVSVNARRTLNSPTLNHTLSQSGRVRAPGGVELADDYREYHTGDDYRDIDWMRSARSGDDHLIIKLRTDREERHLTVMVDLRVLSDELVRLRESAGDDSKIACLSPAKILEAAPHLATLVHEALVAHQHGLKMDLLLTHHGVIKRFDHCADRIIGVNEASKPFLMELDDLCGRAETLTDIERKIFGDDSYYARHPFALLDRPLRKGSLVLMMPSLAYKKPSLNLVPILRKRGHEVTVGPLSGLIKPIPSMRPL